ncbi:sulfate permease [Starmerella bacillaris]|uniref:Sulfate permease n=1 Tax=Starmerella bacillaris TaxID=1247836 RepID=A0AAV5RNJ3_STABA|nr:sulfate permease [Starmerella bacillaris]
MASSSQSSYEDEFSQRATKKTVDVTTYSREETESWNDLEVVPSYANNYEWEYHQPIVSVKEPIQWYFTGFGQRVKNYLISLFPFLQWIYRYNLTWLYGDLIAGITVGIVVVPQGMSYAKIAGLPVQYGLYSSFIGVMLYCFFATSKDVSIGPVAVMSAETYEITHRVLKNVPGLTDADLPVIAGVLSLLCGGITLGLGVLRLGFLLEYIPMPAVMGFMTGSAFTIAVGQVPALMGINKLFNTKDASYLVVINTLKHLHQSNYNACFGILCLFVLYAMKFGFGYLEKRDKRRKWLWFYLGTLRAAFVIIFSTLISWGVYRIYGVTEISMIKTVPRGLGDVGIHTVDPKIASALGSELPIATVVLVLEHIAISKSFGRINEYRINPNQELIAIGVSNCVGHFFQAYPNTGSFSRTALKSKCGVRTPLAGMFTGICVLIAIYALTDAFYYISNAALSAIIIHAVGDLIASYKSTLKFYKVAPIECLIFLVDVILCVFVTLEAGIYFSVAASLVNLLLKQTFPLGEFLGKVQFQRHVVDTPAEPEESTEPKELPKYLSGPVKAARTLKSKFKRGKKHQNTEDEENDDVQSFDGVVVASGPGEPEKQATRPIVFDETDTKVKWWPLTMDNINPDIKVVPPPPGILVYRFRESLTYQNVAWQTDRIVEYVRKHTKRNMDYEALSHKKLGDRPWNDNGPRKWKAPDVEDNRPILRAIVFDMSCSPNVDLTACQTLWDCHQELTKYACVPVEFHFAGVLSEWTRRALIYGGFGGDRHTRPEHTDRLVETAAVKEKQTDLESQLSPEQSFSSQQAETRLPSIINRSSYDEKSSVAFAPLVDTNQCYFHFDIPDLVYKGI